MYFLLSKTIGIFAVPSNAIMGITLCGLLLWPTRWSRIGRKIVVAGLFLLLIAGASPLGTALLLSLENRFPRWDASHGAPTGLVVLGGVINPEVSVKRGEVSLDAAAERLLAAVELYHRYPTLRIVFTGGNSNVVFAAQEIHARGSSAQKVSQFDCSGEKRQNRGRQTRAAEGESIRTRCS